MRAGCKQICWYILQIKWKYKQPGSLASISKWDFEVPLKFFGNANGTRPPVQKAGSHPQVIVPSLYLLRI